jgi:hypothetical protein
MSEDIGAAMNILDAMSALHTQIKTLEAILQRPSTYCVDDKRWYAVCKLQNELADMHLAFADASSLYICWQTAGKNFEYEEEERFRLLLLRALKIEQRKQT